MHASIIALSARVVWRLHREGINQVRLRLTYGEDEEDMEEERRLRRKVCFKNASASALLTAIVTAMAFQKKRTFRAAKVMVNGEDYDESYGESYGKSYGER